MYGVKFRLFYGFNKNEGVLIQDSFVSILSFHFQKLKQVDWFRAKISKQFSLLHLANGAQFDVT